MKIEVIWTDPRLTFHHLKMHGLNLIDAEIDKFWKPKLVVCKFLQQDL